MSPLTNLASCLSALCEYIIRSPLSLRSLSEGVGLNQSTVQACARLRLWAGR